MFIRTKKSPKSPRKSVQIVENIRIGNQVKQKIVHYVGVASDDHEEEKLRNLAKEIIIKKTKEREVLSKQGSLFAEEDLPHLIQKKQGRKKQKSIEDILPTSKVLLDDIEEEKRISDGIFEVGGKLFDDIGFDQLLKNRNDKKLLKDLVLSRIINPTSKLKTHNILGEEFNKEYDLNRIYRIMDKLHLEIDEMKNLSFQKTKRLFGGKIDLLLFDVTTLYFESINTDDLRNFGYSKDHRFNTTQIVLALATNQEGLPVGYELFSGNTAEVKTLITTIEGFGKYLDIKEVYFCADRAMFSDANLELLEQKGYKYVVAAKLRNLDKKTKESILDEKNYRGELVGNDFGFISEFEYKGRRLITSYKSKRARKDLKQRMKILEKLEKMSDKNGNITGQKLVSNSGVKKYVKKLDGQVAINNLKIVEEEKWDGLHGVITNDKTGKASEIVSRYSNLWVIEESFRINKHDLKMRPIFHFKKERIESHIAMCYMSFSIIRNIEYQCNLTQKISPKEIISCLRKVESSIYIHKKTKDRYLVPGYFNNKMAKIYKTFNIIRNRDAQIYLN